MFRVKVLILIAILGLILNLPAYSDDDAVRQEDMRVIRGTVAAVNWVGAVLVVRIVGPRGIPDEVRFVVADKAKITKGTSDTTLSNVNIGDRVTVGYYVDSFMGLRAMFINISI